MGRHNRSKKMVGGQKMKIRRRKTAKCHPKVALDISLDNDQERKKLNSCLSNEDIQKLICEWNRQNVDKIQYRKKDIEGSLSRLYQKMIDCDNDVCLLGVIDDPHKRKKLEKTRFAPRAPSSWKYNKNEWLTNLDIDSVMRQYEDKFNDFKFLGVSPIDFEYRNFVGDTCYSPEICQFDVRNHYGKSKYRRFGIVFNTHPHTSSGEHWICMFIDLNLKKIFYFDSNGNQAPKEVMDLVKKLQDQAKSISKPLTFDSNSGIRYQSGNTECGMYCLFFLINILERKMKFEDFKKGSSMVNDKKMEMFREQYFNKL